MYGGGDEGVARSIANPRPRRKRKETQRYSPETPRKKTATASAAARGLKKALEIVVIKSTAAPDKKDTALRCARIEQLDTKCAGLQSELEKCRRQLATSKHNLSEFRKVVDDREKVIAIVKAQAQDASSNARHQMRLHAIETAKVVRLQKSAAADAAGHSASQSMLRRTEQQRHSLRKELDDTLGKCNLHERSLSAASGIITGHQCALMEIGSLHGFFPPLPGVTMRMQRGNLVFPGPIWQETPNGLDICITGTFAAADQTLTRFETRCQYSTGMVWRQCYPAATNVPESTIV